MNVVGSMRDDCFVDRQDVLDTLESLADNVERERSPRYAFVYGESGVGKTEIIRHFLALQDSKGRDGRRAIRVEGRELKGPPLLPFAWGMLEFKKTQSLARTAVRLALDFMAFVPEVGPYLKKAADTVMEHGMSDMDRIMTGELGMFRHYSRIVKSESRRKMLIFCVDDAQWLDETEMALLDHIIRANLESPVLFVIAARKQDGDQVRNLRSLEVIRHSVRGRSVSIDVEPFTPDSCAEMIRNLSGGSVSDRRVRELRRMTGGNPYLLRHAMLSGATVAPTATFPKLTESLERAYADLPGSKKVLRYAAVLGLRFELPMLSRILEMETGDVFDILSDVKKYGLIKNPGEGEYFEFSHQIAHDSVYGSIKPIRQACHKEVAEFLEREDATAQNHYLIAYHYLKTPHKDLALKHMRLAASASMAGNLFTDASEWLRQCLKVAEKLDVSRKEISAMNVDYARSLLGENKAERSRELLEALVDDRYLSREEQAQVHTMLSKCHRLLGTAESGVKALSHARTAVRMTEGGDPRQAGDAYAYLATVCDHFVDDSSEAKRAYRRAIKCYRGHKIELALLHRKCGMVMESRLAIEEMRRSLRVFEDRRMDIEAAKCLNNIGAECLYVGRFGEARDSLFESLEKFRMRETPEADTPLNNLGLLYLQEGDYRRAMSHFEEALARQSERYNEIAITVNMSTVYRKSGQPRKAADSLYKIEELVMENVEPTLRDYYGFNRGVTHRDLKEWDAAKEWLLKFQPNTYKNDQELALAKRMRALSEICALEGAPGIGADAEAKILETFGTRRPQRWFYEADYYPCDIHMWD